MSKDKLNRLQKYASDIRSRLEDSIPEKHKNRPASYKQFLKNELQTVSSQIDKMKLEGENGKK